MFLFVKFGAYKCEVAKNGRHDDVCNVLSPHIDVRWIHVGYVMLCIQIKLVECLSCVRKLSGGGNAWR